MVTPHFENPAQTAANWNRSVFSVLGIFSTNGHLVARQRHVSPLQGQELSFATAALQCRDDEHPKMRFGCTQQLRFLVRFQASTAFALPSCASRRPWKALQASDIYAQRAYLTEVYRNTLAHQVRVLGYDIDDRHDARGRDLGFEIRGVSQDLVRTYSLRHPDRRHIASYRAGGGSVEAIRSGDYLTPFNITTSLVVVARTRASRLPSCDQA
jgi:hypothetical protein